MKLYKIQRLLILRKGCTVIPWTADLPNCRRIDTDFKVKHKISVCQSTSTWVSITWCRHGPNLKPPRPAICFSELTKIVFFVQFHNIFNKKRSCPHHFIHVRVATIRFLIVFAPTSCPPNLISCFQGHFWWCHERQGHLLPLWDPDWLVLSACKSRRRWPGVHWPNYAKHIT